ncbi:copper transporter [Kineosporia babensis]|uniref:Copper transporter n=1 Tax=Kineosporia babensis TaxID=499548 RepID=A0A9X1NEM9_9ACTN|nr:copper transporter [Kineosporia babensis]MCD5312449.1 copper transporter [Kineosporia babensis]
MIDFRYHLVSLISVFLALAVGIVLGAGPLQNSIGTQLTEQVNQLRADRDELREQLATSTAAVTHRDEFTLASTPALVSGTLTGRSVAVIELPGVEQDVVEPLTEAIATAGGSVTGRIRITENWTAADKEADRTGALSSLTGELPSGYVPTDGSTAERLAQVLATSTVTSAGTTLTGTSSTDAAKALNGLSTAELIEVDGDLNGLASGALLVAPVNPEATGAAQATAPVTGEVASAYVALAGRLDSTGGGAVITGPASSAASGGVLTAIREDDAVSSDVSTVDTGSTAMGVITAVLALEEQLSGGSGSYGFAEGVDEISPPITARTSTSEPESGSSANSSKKGDGE